MGRAMAGRVHGLWDNHIVSFRLPKGRVEGRGNMALEDEATWKVWSRRPDRQLLEDMGFKWPTAGLLQMTIREEMMEYGVDQNTINYNSLLSKSKEPRRNGETRMRMKSWTHWM